MALPKFMIWGALQTCNCIALPCRQLPTLEIGDEKAYSRLAAYQAHVHRSKIK